MRKFFITGFAILILFFSLIYLTKNIGFVLIVKSYLPESIYSIGRIVFKNDLNRKSLNNDYIVKFFNPRDIIIGYDHHFGNNKQGSKKFLIKNSKKYNYNLHTKDVVLYDNIPISSSRIRRLLTRGNINDANECLGYNYELNGVVIKGNGVGKEIGFPTINILPYMGNQLIPAQGVYCVDVKIKKKIYTGMCNIGIRPTFYKSGEQSIEVHLLTDDIVDYYDEKVSVSFKSYLRE